jgi:hypothetical protein
MNRISRAGGLVIVVIVAAALAAAWGGRFAGFW